MKWYIMKIETVRYESNLGRPVEYTYRRHEEQSDILSVVFPGLAYYKDAPLMWYSAISAFEAGSDALNLEYGFQSNRSSATDSAIEETIREVSVSLHDFLKEHQYRKVIFISKSIGTYMVSKLCSDSFNTVQDHIFQTPLQPTVEFMQHTKNALVLVGENDPAFGASDMEKIRNLGNLRLVTFPEANHIMEVSGDYSKSLEYLVKVTSETFSFVENVVKAK